MNIGEFRTFMAKEVVALDAKLQQEAKRIPLKDILEIIKKEEPEVQGGLGYVGMQSPELMRELRYTFGQGWLNVCVTHDTLRFYGGSRGNFSVTYKSEEIADFYKREKQRLQDVFDNIDVPF